MTNFDHSPITPMTDCLKNDLPTDLAAEFKAWETASDEALENFEKGIEIPEQST